MLVVDDAIPEASSAIAKQKMTFPNNNPKVLCASSTEATGKSRKKKMRSP